MTIGDGRKIRRNGVPNGINWVPGTSPGLDVNYGNEIDRQRGLQALILRNYSIRHLFPIEYFEGILKLHIPQINDQIIEEIVEACPEYSENIIQIKETILINTSEDIETSQTS